MRQWRKARREAEEVNLLPVMNLMVTLIPFLLLGAAFYKLGNIPTTIPQKVAAGEAPKTPEKKISVTCDIEPSRITITASGAGLDEAGADALGAVFVNKGGKPDLKSLTNHLEVLKSQYPKSDTIVFAPHGDLPYQELVVIVDATREKVLPGQDANGEPLTRDLFPVTVFSYVQTAKPEDSAEGQEGGGE